MEIQIKNQQKIVKLDLKKTKEIIIKILNLLGIDERNEISFLFTDDAMIKSLNSKYRSIDQATDVLSFAFEEGKDTFPSVGVNRILGDIIISIETAKRQAIEANHSLEWEIIILLVHGILHLLGYDHVKEKEFNLMHKKEVEILERLVMLNHTY